MLRPTEETAVPKPPIDRRSAIRAAAVGGMAVAAGTIAGTVSASSASAAATGTDDPAIAGLVGAAASETRRALNADFTVYRVWDGAANAYPARVVGASNVFIGPHDPGLAMDAHMDVWADPRNTTIDDVVAQMRASGSELWKAARATQPDVSFAVTPRGTEVTERIGTAPNDVQLLALNQSSVSGVQFSGRFPSDWKVATVRAHWLHGAGTGSARFEFAFRVLTSTGVANSYTTKQTYVSSGAMVPNEVVFNAREVTGGGLVNGWLTRHPGASDTIAAPIGVLSVIAERVE